MGNEGSQLEGQASAPSVETVSEVPNWSVVDYDQYTAGNQTQENTAPPVASDTIAFNPNENYLQEMTGDATPAHIVSGIENGQSLESVEVSPTEIKEIETKASEEAAERVRVNNEISVAEKGLADSMGENIQLSEKVKHIPPQVAQNPSFRSAVGGFFADALENPDTSGNIVDAGGSLGMGLVTSSIVEGVWAGGSDKGRDTSNSLFNLGINASLGGMLLGCVAEAFSILNNMSGGMISKGLRGEKTAANTKLSSTKASA